jgi:hypothetical protein
MFMHCFDGEAAAEMLYLKRALASCCEVGVIGENRVSVA